MNNINIILNTLNDYPVFIPEDTHDKVARAICALSENGIDYPVVNTTVGPTYTLIELMPTEKVGVSKFKKLTEDITMILIHSGVRVIAPTPGKRTIGIEIPNDKPQIVGLSKLLQSPDYMESESQLPIAVGMDVAGNSVVADLATMPHLLVAGATGQGKSVFLNSLIISLLSAKNPEELQLMLIDPKMVEFAQYSSLANSYLLKVEDIEDSVITDYDDAKAALEALYAEMERRHTLLDENNAKNIIQYNESSQDKLHYIVAVIDEYADLIMIFGKDLEALINQLAQKAHAVGIHIVLATQRPSKNIITGLIKANIPARIAFKVSQNTDSKTIIDCQGATDLLGRGDMLFSNNGCVTRLQGAFVDSPEIDKVVKCPSQHSDKHNHNLVIKQVDIKENNTEPKQHSQDPLFDQVVKFMSTQESVSTTMLQRKFEIGYNRAGKLIDELEAAGIVGPSRGAQPRTILINKGNLH